VVCLAAAAAVAPARARVYVTQQEALARLFPAPVEVSRHTAYLSEEQAARVAELAGRPLEHRVVPYYVGRRDGQVIGYAFTDVHLVRTLSESVLFALDAGGRIRSVEILSFDEPPEYLPGPRWLEQLEGRALDENLSLKRDIRTLTGATLSSRAITAAARRVLALFEVIAGAGGGAAGERR
jgi:Na+-translocating ferredoxin:NAD+ oxidoreductase RnfG subunit